MKVLPFLFLFLPIFLIGQADTRKSLMENGGVPRVQLKKFEEKLLLENNDEQAVALITHYYKAKDKIYDHKIEAINSYSSTLTQRQKSKKYIRENSENEQLTVLKDTAEEAKTEMRDYLRSAYPVYDRSLTEQEKRFNKRRQ